MSKRRFTEESYRKEPWFRALCQAFLACKTEEQMANFLRDVATLSEMKALSERFEVAKQLLRGFSYRSISKNTGASTTTVTRVGSFLDNGTGGYRFVLKNSGHHHTSSPTPASAHSATAGRRGERPDSVLRKYVTK